MSAQNTETDRHYVLYHCGLPANSLEEAQKKAAELVNDKRAGIESVVIVREVQVVKRPKRRGFVA